MAYKERVPVCGAILISEYWDKVRRIPRSFFPGISEVTALLTSLLLHRSFSSRAGRRVPAGPSPEARSTRRSQKGSALSVR